MKISDNEKKRRIQVIEDTKRVIKEMNDLSEMKRKVSEFKKNQDINQIKSILLDIHRTKTFIKYTKNSPDLKFTLWTSFGGISLENSFFSKEEILFKLIAQVKRLQKELKRFDKIYKKQEINKIKKIIEKTNNF